MDFIKICRACTSEKTNLLNLFANDCDDEPTLGEKFLVCTSLDLQEADSYPQHICYSCAKLLETAYKFRKQCERSFNQLQKRLLSMQTCLQKHIKDEPSEESNQKIESICVDDDETSLLDNETLETEEYVEAETLTEVKVEKEAQLNSLDNISQTDGDAESNSNPPIEKSTEKKLIDVNITIEERPHQCDDCGKCFFTVKALELHMKLTHKPKKSNSNDADEKSFETQSSSLFLCSICDTQLDNIDDLRMHRIIEHGPKSLKCNLCGKSMRDRIAYRKHLLSHKNSERHFCKICGKQYTDSRYLYRHMLYHQAAVYKCEEPNCEKYFNVKHKCVEHIRLYHNRKLTSDEVRQMQPTNEVEME